MLIPEKLALEFRRKFKERYRINPFTLNTIKNTKWWVHFQNFCKRSILPDGYESYFINKLFDDWDDEKQLWPYVLSQKRAKDIEEAIFSLLNYDEASGLTEKDYIYETFKRCNFWYKQNNIKENYIKSFITNPSNGMLAERGYYYLPIFLFSKSFCKRHGIISDDEKKKKDSIRAFYPSVYDTLKNALKEDFLD